MMNTRLIIGPSTPHSPESATATSHDLRVVVLDRFHQFRNESEVEQESKGGFLSAEIHLPRTEEEEEEAELEISLAAAEEDAEENPFAIHPNLIFLAGCRTASACRNGGDRDPHIYLRVPT